MRLHVIRDSITTLEVDAIVNAANSSLLGGGGVDGAIHRAGGRAILEECMAIRARQGKCRVGEAVITTAGKMPAKYVIHTVGPHWNQGRGNEAEKLAACYTNSLALAEEHRLQTIAFPNISTGIYGYPKEEAAEVALRAVSGYSPRTITDVYFVCFDSFNFELYRDQLPFYQG